jgi:hypothetical protein
MSNNWLNNIRHVAPGEPVKASIVGRPDRALEERTSYLKDRLDAAELGRALFDTDATISPDVVEGMPVFWNFQTQQYEKALAAVENDEVTQTLVTQASSDCVGILYNKKSNTLGDVVLRGIVRMPAIANAVSGSVKPGRYYLSATDPGKLTQQKPPVTVSVCYVQGAKDNCADDPWVVVMPQMRDFLDDHIHYRFELETTAAGTVAYANGKYTITNPNADAKGWLPANHAVFNGKAPAGAVFGYNFKADLAISRVWPPVPIMAVAMLWDKGVDLVGATEIPLGRSGLAVCDLNGIWWMSDCTNDVPWVRDLTSASSSSTGSSSSNSSSSNSSSSGAECPRVERMRVVVVYIRMLFGNDRSVVTSLQSAPGSPITVVNCDGLPAKTGDLELGLELNLAVMPPDVTGARVLKRIEGGYKFRPGWVTEGIVSGSPAIVLRSVKDDPNYIRALTTAEKTALGLPAGEAATAHQGLVKITFDDALAEREIAPQIIRLSDVVERLYLDIPYLGFPAGQDSLIRVRLPVVSSGLGTALQMRLRAQIFGRVAGTLPQLIATYRILSRPGAVGSALPEVDVTPNLTFESAIEVAQDTAIEINSAALSVNEGDTVLVTIRRPLIAGNPDAYLSEVGLLRLSGIVTTT